MKSWRKMGGAGVFERDQKSREAQAASEKRNWREFGWRGSCQTELREWSGMLMADSRIRPGWLRIRP